MSKSGKNVRAKVVQRNLARSQAKERSKIAKEVSKIQSLNAGDKDPHIQQLYKNFQELLDGHNALVEAFNANVKGYNNQISHLDMRLGAAYSVIQDMYDGTAVTKVVQIEGTDKARIAWPVYIENYLDTVRKEMERLDVERAANQVAVVPSAEAEESPLFTPVTPDEHDESKPDTVFGGDHVQTQQQPSAT